MRSDPRNAANRDQGRNGPLPRPEAPPPRPRRRPPGEVAPAFLRPASAADWLNALDGVAYLAAPNGVVLEVGRAGWAAFAAEAAQPSPPPEAVIGRSLFTMIEGEEVRAAFQALHARVASLARKSLAYEYRCDAPDIERYMRMSLSALVSEGRLQGVLYQSVQLTAVDRVPLEFLKPREAAIAEGRLADLPFVRICQFCADVTMRAWAGAWVRPADYYRRGGSDAVRLSHGVCPTCERERLAPLLAD